MARGEFTEKTFAVGASEVRLRRYGVDVLLFEVRGHLSLELAQAMITEAERALQAADKIHVLHDWEQVTGYDNLSRLELTKFVLVDRNRFRSAHLLVHARDVAFGVEVANIVLKHKITVHQERASFERALAQTIPLALQRAARP